MKKVLFVMGMVLAAISAKAQFTVYQPVGVPQRSYTPSSGYGTPFTIYEPIDMGGYRQSSRPRMQQVTLTGYYKGSNGWCSTPIRVGVTGDEVVLLSIKAGYGWSNCGNRASEVGAWDTEEIRDNFNYKAFSSLYGTVYF